MHNFYYLMKESVHSLKKNAWMSGASILTVAITLFLCGFFYLLVSNIDAFGDNLEKEVEIAVFPQEELAENEIQDIMDKILTYPEVAAVNLITKEEALEQMKERYGEEHDLLTALGGENPLPDSLVITTNLPEDVSIMAEKVASWSEVERVRYGQGYVEKLFSVLSWLRFLGTSIMALLAFSAIILISITIRLNVYSRKDEVIIMKYVGASDWFIRFPFLLEGIFLGFSGSLLAFLGVHYLYRHILFTFSESLAFIQVIPAKDIMFSLALIIMFLGIVLGGIGSIFSVRKFLKV